jgi:subtilisin family serine protease
VEKVHTYRASFILVLLIAIFLSLAGKITAFVGSDDKTKDKSSALLYLEAEVFDPLETMPALPMSQWGRKGKRTVEEDNNYFIVQFRGTVLDEWKDRIIVTGARILGYLPENAFLVEGNMEAFQEIDRMGPVRWIGLWAPYFKVSSELRENIFKECESPEVGRKFVAILFPGVNLEMVLDKFEDRQVDVIQVVKLSEDIDMRTLLTDRIVFQGTGRDVLSAVEINEVSWIEPLILPEKRNDKTQWVIQTNRDNRRSVWRRRILGAGQIVGHIDGQIDINSCYFADGNNGVGPEHRKIIAYRSSSGYGVDTHGTHTAGTIAGDATYVGESWLYDGMAPAAKLSFSNLDDINNSNLMQYLGLAYQDGARVHSNSWGNDWTTEYTQWCRDIDQFSHDQEENLVCFAVSNMNNLKTPENAKNVLAVGATSMPPNQDEHCTGGRGPTLDGRMKPDIFAPGCNVRSAWSSNSTSTSNYMNCSTTTMSGTSMASPAVAGSAVLVRDYFQSGWYPTGSRSVGNELNPSGALVKAALLNGAVDMTDVPGYPNYQEGWGRILLENTLYFDEDPHNLIVKDVRMDDGFMTGDMDTLFFDVSASNTPLKITLVWHDYPASVGVSHAAVNNLDLYVRSPGGTVYRGNVFKQGQSARGGRSDTINNVEQIHRSSPQAGRWGLLVMGKKINMGPQGYALVISGSVSEIRRED